VKIRIDKLEKTKFAFAGDKKGDWDNVKEGINYSMEFRSAGKIHSFGVMDITEHLFTTLKVGCIYNVSMKFSRQARNGE
jgi:hypothetical protein